MKTELLNIAKGQCLTDVLPAIPTNTIFDKTITGCGATHSEIVNAARNSIIIEPNIPVIIGKKADHPFLFAVYEGITKEDVKAYLAGEHDGYRKSLRRLKASTKRCFPPCASWKFPSIRTISCCSTSAKRLYRMWATEATSICLSRIFQIRK